MKKTNLLLCSALLFGTFATGLISCNKNPEQSEHGDEEKPEVPAKTITLETLIEAIPYAKENSGTISNDLFVVKGKVTRFIDANKNSYLIRDDTGELNVILDNIPFTTKPQINDEVSLKGHLSFIDNKATLLKATIEDLKPYEPSQNKDGYIESTIAYARNLEVGTNVILTGVVASISNDGKGQPANFFLVDESGSINVYSKDLASKLEIGNKITIKATRSNYISSREVDAAASWNYKGSIQVKDAILVSNDEKIHDFDKSWILDSSMKHMMETPVSENVTTTIYKIKGFIHKKEGTGFTNYIINDLDDKTGSYTYSQNNGKDYAWLDEFDGKLCDIYISPINCKASSSSCYFRFTPIKVDLASIAIEDEKVLDYVYEYYIEENIEAFYESNPETVLPTTFKDDKLGISGITLSYKSSDDSVIKFVKEGDNAILIALKDGTTTLKIELNYLTYKKIIELDTTVKFKVVEGAIGVKEAIDSDDNTEVIVKGIVQASMLTRRGFYLADRTGVISILVKDASILEDIKIGDEVYIKGTKTHFEDSKTEGYPGQITIQDAELVLNNYGRHELDKTSYDNSKTMAEIVNIPLSEDVTAKVFTTKCKVEYVKGGYSVNVYLHDLQDESKSLFVYNSNEGEVEFLKEFADKEVTIDVALCNWNGKTNYRACVLSISDGTTTKLCDHFLKK